VLGIIIAGLLVFYILGRWMIRKQLKPVKKLAVSANHIAEGNYNEALPFIDRHDEIGLLQNRFKQMQHSLQDQVEKLKEETAVLYQHGDIQLAAYDKTLEVDKMKTSFLNYMTNQVSIPVEDIDKAVTALCNNYQNLSKEEKDHLVNNIQLHTKTMVKLLNHVAHFAETETGKEAPND
jgi:methyl-accepting chemotaxis protein